MTLDQVLENALGALFCEEHEEAIRQFQSLVFRMRQGETVSSGAVKAVMEEVFIKGTRRKDAGVNYASLDDDFEEDAAKAQWEDELGGHAEEEETGDV